MSQYRKKPVVIDAIQWDGSLEMAEKIIKLEGIDALLRFNVITNAPELAIKTLEGIHNVSPQDYIIKGVKGEYYPCKPDIFEATYDSVTNEESRDLTFGEKLVGMTFNPSGDPNIQKAKELCAELADMIYNDYAAKEEVTDFYDYLYEHSVGEILNAQMNVVKLLTFKH